MRSIAIVLSTYLLHYAFALPAPASRGPIFELNEIKFHDSADWSRVVGGSNASIGQFPYMASLRSASSNIHLCGASIISSRYLLSAAHCTSGASPSFLTVVVGTVTLNSGGTSYPLNNVLNHPNFSWDTIENDISLLKTASAIIGSSVVASIPISSSYVGAGVTVTLSGWGTTFLNGSSPNILQYVNLRTLDNSECTINSYPIFNSSICTLTQAGQGPCHGDSGGPLTANGVLVGIVSWGEPCAVGYPDVFTRVSSYVTWILENAT